MIIYNDLNAINQELTSTKDQEPSSMERIIQHSKKQG